MRQAFSIGLAFLLPVLAGCSSPQPDAEQQAEPEPSQPEATATESEIFSSGFESGDSAEWSSSAESQEPAENGDDSADNG